MTDGSQEHVTAEEYRLYMTMVITAANTIDAVPVDKLLRDLSRTEALGPVMAPAAYRARAGQLKDHRRLLEAARELQTVLRAVRTKYDTFAPPAEA